MCCLTELRIFTAFLFITQQYYYFDETTSMLLFRNKGNCEDQLLYNITQRRRDEFKNCGNQATTQETHALEYT